MISYHCNLCEKPAVLLLSEDGESRLLCADHSPFPFAPIAELATLRADRDALAARVAAARQALNRTPIDYGALYDALDDAAPVCLRQTTPERGGTEGGRG